MKKITCFLFLTFLCLTSFSQVNKTKIIKHSGYDYYSICDRVYENVDSIRFIMSSPLNPQNPTILFSQGSGNYPLIGYYADIDTIISFALIPPFNIEEYKNSYNFICIAKPGTPVCIEWTNEKQLPLIDTTYPEFSVFNKMDFLDYYVSQTGQVIDYLKSNILNPNADIYLIGNSQGGRVAIKYTCLNQEKVQKLILYSSGVLDRHVEEILYWRQLADCNSISAEEAQNEINDVYVRYQELKQYFNSCQENNYLPSEDLLIRHNSAINDYSYNFDIPLDYLLKIDIPILCVYGTSDLKARDNDMLPLYFARENKNNLTMLPIMNCDHLFVETKIDTESGEEVKTYIGDEVFSKIVKWMK